MKYRQVSNSPTQKAWAASAAALIVPIVLWALKAKWPDMPLPIDASDLLGVVVMAFLTGGSTFAAAWFKRPNSGDQIKQEVPE